MNNAAGRDPEKVTPASPRSGLGGQDLRAVSDPDTPVLELVVAPEVGDAGERFLSPAANGGREVLKPLWRKVSRVLPPDSSSSQVLSEKMSISAPDAHLRRSLGIWSRIAAVQDKPRRQSPTNFGRTPSPC